MEVRIYIQTNIRGPRARAGRGIYLLEAVTERGPATLNRTIEYEKETENGAEIKTVLAALKRMTKPSDITIHTDTGYTANAYQNGWLGRWLANGWKNAKGDPIAHQEEWQQLQELFGQQHVNFAVGQQHEYKNWMIDQIRRKD